MFLKPTALVYVLWVSVAVDCRSVGEPVGVNCPDQSSYQDYGEQQEYVERQVRDVEDRPEKYIQKDYARESRSNANEGVKSEPEAAYQSRNNGDDDDSEGASAQVAADRREWEQREVQKEDEAVDAEVVDQRNNEGLRQASNNEVPQADAGYRQSRENMEAEPQEPARVTEAVRAPVADAGYDAMNEPQANSGKDDSAYVAANYNYDYAPEQESPQGAEGQQNMEQNVAPGNEEGAAPSQYEQGK